MSYTAEELKEIYYGMKTKEHDAIILSSEGEKDSMGKLADLYHKSPLPDDEQLPNLGMFLTSKSLSRILFFYEIYKLILNTHGVIMEFGVRWGQTLCIMQALRGIFEPFNRHRKVIGFDTFEGLKGVSKWDGTLADHQDGNFSVPKGYEYYLNELLGIQESLNPISHLKKFEIIKSDVREKEGLYGYLSRHPETIISLAIFDFDIYDPTVMALRWIKPRLCKGSVIVFDELCDDIFPGETIALREVLGLNTIRINRFPFASRLSYVVIE